MNKSYALIDFDFASTWVFNVGGSPTFYLPFHMHKHRNHSGFSLVGLLVAILLIGVIIALTIAFQMSKQVDQTQSEHLDSRNIHFVSEVGVTAGNGLSSYTITAPDGQTAEAWGRPGIPLGEEVRILPQSKLSHLVSPNKTILISYNIAGSSQ